MKALKSPTAKALMADPQARAKLRAFLTVETTIDEKRPPIDEDEYVIVVQSKAGKTLRVRPVIVPKAA